MNCPICHDFLVTPVLTNCNHTFCHLCIAKNMAIKDNIFCPLCRIKITTLTFDHNYVDNIYRFAMPTTDLNHSGRFNINNEEQNIGVEEYEERRDEQINDTYPTLTKIHEGYKFIIDTIERHPTAKLYNYIFMVINLSIRTLQLFLLLLIISTTDNLLYTSLFICWTIIMIIDYYFNNGYNYFKIMIDSMYNNIGIFQMYILTLAYITHTLTSLSNFFGRSNFQLNF